MTSTTRASGPPCPIWCGSLRVRSWHSGCSPLVGPGPSHMSERIDSCLVVGGGIIAARVIAGLLEAGTRVTVVSPWLTPALPEVAREGRLSWWARQEAAGAVSRFARG